MTFLSGSMTDSNAPATLAGLMHDALITEGYSLVDTVVIGTRTHKVYLSPAASNTEGIDWYLDLAYTTTGTGSIWLGAFETYDAVAHTAGFGPVTTGATVDPVEFSRYGATKYALETKWGHVSNDLAQIQTSASAFAYWISITPTKVIALSSGNATKVVYCGQFDPYTPWKTKAATDAPGKWNPLTTLSLVLPNAEAGRVASVADVGCGLTRLPPVATIYDWGISVSAGCSSSTSSTTNGGGGGGGAVGLVDTGWNPYTDGGPQGEKIQIRVLRQYNVGIGRAGHCAGELYDVARFGTSGATSVTRGDTATVDSATWVLASATSSACFGFKAS